MTGYDTSKILTVTGDTFDECKKRLYELHGKDYEIIERKQVSKNTGFLGLVKKDVIEVAYVPSPPGKPLTKNSFPFLPDVTDQNQLESVKEEILSHAGKSKGEVQFTELSNKLANKLDELSAQLQNIPRYGGEEKVESIEKIESLLEENEFTRDFINSIASRLKKEFSLDDLGDFKKVERQVVDWIGEAIAIAPEKTWRRPHVVVVVGPTGVGKTTTIAKLAAQQRILQKNDRSKALKLFMITTDRTRVGAEAQLKRLSDVLNIEMEKAENSDDLKEIFTSRRDDYDIIYIDTSGYSPKDYENIARLKTTLSVKGMNPEVHLALAASTKARDIKTILQNYESFDYNSVIVTKWDETSCYGNIISVLSKMGKSVSYITNGQDVARDIKPASKVEFLINLSGFNIDRVHIEEIFGENDGRPD